MPLVCYRGPDSLSIVGDAYMGGVSSKSHALASMEPWLCAQLWVGGCEESQEEGKVLPFDSSC